MYPRIEIRVGNGTMTTGAINAVTDVGKAIVAPITQPWAQGQYVESVTRGVVEIATLPLAALKSGKIAKAGNAASDIATVSKAAGGAADANKVAHIGDATKLPEPHKPNGDGGKVKAPEGRVNNGWDATNSGLGLVELDPNAIRFTQTTVKQQGATIPNLVESMKQNGFVVEPDRLIDVVRMPDGMLTSLDNTRILAAQRAGVNIQARVFEHTDLLPTNDLDYISRFIGRKGEVPTTYGDAVTNRINIQSKQFRTLYLNGSPYTGSSY